MPSLTFLIVDDNELQRRVAESCLQQAGHRVVFAATAAEVEALDADLEVSVVLVSAALPADEARRTLITALRPRTERASGATLPPPAVVIGAGEGETSLAAQLVARGASGVVVRPYERARLGPQLELFSVGAAPAHILVIDDSPTTRRTSASILRRAGHTPFEAGDGVEGLAVLERHPEIDLVLTDVIMPKLDGYQVCHAIRARPNGQRLPVLLLTALDDIASQSRAIEVGADDVLTKPITATELQLRVRSMLRLKGLQQKLATRNEELEHALELGQHLTHMLVHDFRNPMTRVLVSAEMIIDACRDAGLDEPAELGEDVLSGALRLRGLTDDLLQVARIEEGAMAPEPCTTPLRELTEAIVEDLRRVADAGDVRVRTDVPAELSVEADRDWTYRVLQNLVDNALKYSPQGGRIGIRARREGDEAYVEVSDEGPRIPAALRERVFDKFARVPKKSRRGSGLGLAFCRLAVEAHGGRIGVSGPDDDDGDGDGDGSTFWFRLPASPAPAAS